MEPAVLSDKNLYPTDEVIFSKIGPAGPLWSSFFEAVHARYPGFSEEWRYYNDGKSWLMKVTMKKKTIFWLSVIRDAFRVTFYFTDRAEDAIMRSDISDTLKTQFRNGKHYNKIRGLTILFENPQDIEYAMTSIAIKLRVK